MKNWLLRKDSDAWKDWWQEEKGTAEDENVGWHHGLDGYESEQALAAADGQGILSRCTPWGCKESAWLSDWTELKEFYLAKRMVEDNRQHAKNIGRMQLWLTNPMTVNFQLSWLPTLLAIQQRPR